MDLKIQQLSDEMCKHSSKESNYYPIDRYFINKFYIDNILKENNYIDFIIYNLESTPNLYSEQLLLCLPEIWEDFTIEKIRIILERLTSSFSFYSFLRFTYKYIEIDLFEEIFLNKKIDMVFKKNIYSYFKNIVSTLYKDEDDFFDFNEKLIGVELEQWEQVKIKLLSDKRIKPISMTINELYLMLISRELELVQ